MLGELILAGFFCLGILTCLAMIIAIVETIITPCIQEILDKFGIRLDDYTVNTCIIIITVIIAMIVWGIVK